jgi:putative transposase
MASLIFNEVLSIDSPTLSGLYRIIAPSPCGELIRLGFISGLDGVQGGEQEPKAAGGIESVERQFLEDLLANHQLKSILLRPPSWMLASEEQMPEKPRKLWTWRCSVCRHMLDPERLMATVGLTGQKAALIRLILDDKLCSRPEAYKLWRLLAVHGFTTGSLVPRFDLCGAPGVLRPVNEERKKAGAKKKGYASPEDVQHPQRGLTEEDHTIILHHGRRLQRPGISAATLYNKVIEAGYVREYVEVDGKRMPVLPPQGTFPNPRQVRHVIESRMSDLERVLKRTTVGHFLRNLRGMRGRSYDGVAGPGHTFAIDSTVADIFLRSAINPAWIIGRPIVYIIVDVYSGAVVGFYVCLEGPAWRDAKLALYCAVCGADELASLTGIQPIRSLWPAPTLPFKLRGDRGEYLSLGARQTGVDLSMSYEYAPPRRPDWKGLVEVFHRIMKDQQFGFVPGAFDARRAELELRKSKCRESSLTIREYVQYLHGLFEHMNLYADRSSRMTVEMLAAGVEPTPSGIWRFGHEAGLGYQRSLSDDLLVKHLLRQGSATVRRDGIFFESQEYSLADIDRHQEWTRQARRSGAIDLSVYFHPYSLVDPVDGLSSMTLRGNARATPDTTLYDWRDALMVDRRKNDDRAYARLQAALNLAAEHRQMFKLAKERTLDAEASTPPDCQPNITEARALELMGMSDAPVLPDAASSGAALDTGADYLTMIDEVFTEMNRGAQ